jgi:sulfhydrogenase subunit alpha
MNDTESKLMDNSYDRFFEKIMFGQSFLEAPIIASHICGSNSIANNIASMRAIEIACGIVSSAQTEKLRNLMLYAQIIQSHTVHLYSTILPIIISVSSLSELQKDHRELFKNAVYLKNFGDKIAETIGGRSLHPIANIPGGFTVHPTTNNLKNIVEYRKEIIESAKNTLATFGNLDYPVFESKNIFATVCKQGDYSLSGHGIWTSEEKHFTVEKYQEHILEELRPHSTIKYATINGKETMVGPLARLTINKIEDKEIREFITDLNIKIDENNPFHNIIATAVELYYFVTKAIETIENLSEKGIISEPIKQTTKFGYGTAGCESPDGTIIHSYKLNSEGNIISCDIITPTVFNLPCFESSRKILEKTIKGYDQIEKNKISKLLFESYYLCMTCGPH